MARNVSGEGTRPYYYEPKDRWQAAVTLGYGADGKQKRKWVYGKTERECQKKLNTLKKRRDEGTLSAEKSMTVSAYYEHWTKVKTNEVAARTLEEYSYTSRHVLSRIGKHHLDKLTPLHVQKMQLDIVTEKSAATAFRARRLLYNMLDDALKLGLVYRNVADAVDPVKVKKNEYKIWTAHEIIRFLAHAEPSPYYALFYLGLTTGMRPGEMIALHWSDIDDDRITVSRSVSLVKGKPILGPTKNRRIRVLTLHEDSATALTKHRELTGDNALVFPSRTGQMIYHGNISRSLEAWANRAEVPIIRVHDLRHTYASMCIAQGMDAARLSRNLGHADPAFTYSKYVHIFDRYQPQTTLSLNQLLGVDM